MHRTAAVAATQGPAAVVAAVTSLLMGVWTIHLGVVLARVATPLLRRYRVKDRARGRVKNRARGRARDRVKDRARASVRDRVKASVRDRAKANVRDRAKANARDRASLVAVGEAMQALRNSMNRTLIILGVNQHPQRMMEIRT